jgi:hypothetical protein
VLALAQSTVRREFCMCTSWQRMNSRLWSCLAGRSQQVFEYRFHVCSTYTVMLPRRLSPSHGSAANLLTGVTLTPHPTSHAGSKALGQAMSFFNPCDASRSALPTSFLAPRVCTAAPPTRALSHSRRTSSPARVPQRRDRTVLLDRVL